MPRPEQDVPRETKQVRSTPTTERKSAPLVTGVEKQPRPEPERKQR